MRVALMHRRLSAGMALAALAAFAAGAGLSAPVALAGAGLVLALVWQPGPEASAWVERGSRAGVLALCAWMLYVAFVLVADFMPAVLAMLLFLLVTECLRSLEAKNDMRLYSLSFALLIAATAYYPGVGFALAFVGYIALATLGMMVGYLRRQAEVFRIAEIPVGRPFLVATAALSGVTVLISVVLFVVFPRLPRQWNVQGRAGGGEVMAGFGDEVSLGEHGGRITSNPEVAFRVEFPDGRPAETAGMRWRGRSFDRFDGVRWSRSRDLPLSSPGPWQYRERWGGPFRTQRIFGGPPGARVLFGLHPVVEIVPRSAIRVLRDPTGDAVFFGTDEPVYTVVSAAALPPDEVLLSSPDEPPPMGTHFLQLPPLPERVRRLADSLVAGRGTRLERARAVERWLQTQFRYTLELPATEREAALDAFLFERRAGHCEYFASAMTVLLRASGVPARNVTGFVGGEWNEFGNYLAVTGNDAHAWTEVWFPDVGWVPFDPTPAGSRLEALRERERTGWTWPGRFWLDGVEHRWYKWVLDYNLEKQLGLLRDAGDLFRRNNGPAGPLGGGAGGRDALSWLLAAAVLGAGIWFLRGRRRAAVSPEGRAYLALRRAYARAGWAATGVETPLAWAEALSREGAPGAEAARRAVDLYLRARFKGEPLGEAGRAALAEAIREARGGLRRGGRRRAARRETAGV